MSRFTVVAPNASHPDPQATLSVDQPSHAITQLRLRVVAGPDVGHVVAARGARTIVGSHESCELRLTDPTVSRFHCELVVQGGEIAVRDVGSRNGTVVNGVSVLTGRVTPGAVLVVGRTKIHIETGDELVYVPISSRERFGSLVGRSRPMAALFATLERAAASDANVLLQGETGTGKDAAAVSIHQESARRDGPFVVVDCGSITPNLIESELFGHERGAFTGAVVDRPGALEIARGGTLFIDEIGELPLDLQPKLLRALDRREVKRVGSSSTNAIDVRLIAATNRNLYAEVNAGHFRADLYFRLAVLDITMPPLRERPEDFEPIIKCLIELLGVAQDPRAAPLCVPEFAAGLSVHPWPGNVRELRNYLERCVAFDAQLPLPTTPHDPLELLDPHQPLRVVRERWVRLMERTYFARLLELHGGNVSAAARAAGIDRVHFHRLLARNGLR